MASFEDEEHRILIALYIEAQKGNGQLLGLEELAARYNVHVDAGALRAVAGELESMGHVYCSKTWDGLHLGLHDAGLKPVLNKILHYLDATSFIVSWKHERITTDANKRRDVPAAEGWTMMYWENDERPTPSPLTSLRQDDWPGIPWSPKRNGPSTVGGDYIVHNHAAGSSGHVYKNHEISKEAESAWSKWGVAFAAIGLAIAIAVWLYGDNVIGR